MFLVWPHHETFSFFVKCDLPEGCNRVYAGRGQENECCGMPPRVFQAIERTEKIGLYDIVRIAIHAGLNAWFRRCLDEEIEIGTTCLEV